MSATPEQRFRRRTFGGAFLTSVGFILLLEVGDVGWIHAVGLCVLLGILPTAAVAQVPLLSQMDVPRLQAYASSGVTIVAVGLLSLMLSRVGDLGGLGFVPLPAPALVGWTAGLVVAGVGVVLLFRWTLMALGMVDDPLTRALLPTTTDERWAFAGLSVVAGFGEEMAYRGYALALLIPLVGTVGGVALASAVFGLLHAYQGVQGILRTATIGVAMCVGFLASGSLWPPVLAHVIYDILAGIFLTGYLMVPEADTGVVEVVDVVEPS